ncbi:phage tail sheath family protein [Mangrovicoccus algicola]|uniref:Phage tail sheath subtilisin-like domain-containing protein n=1 Tax=Mangrovicoccus algicola TaxID=2771008 RepID=A0A8J6YVF6_9RHOB|nr:phage tail sheath subtilisin-like domain-containing protein [Mangrovicoccus algicola]MBE3638362.1 phage tail sheath subtilisin-like domain-containing protein [Mangrovicoccus algicola]
MPEYLAPGVYVEEVPSANKPIQAAGTSTAGMVGMTQRGPVNRPTLMTSRGAFARNFGGLLDPLTYSRGRDALPYAVEGFFGNGGARVYVTRIVGPGAAESTLALVAQTAVNATPVLAGQAGQGATTLLVDAAGALGADDTVLIADGTGSEMVAVTADPVVPRAGIAGLSRSYPAGTEVTLQTVTPIAGTLTGDLEAGADSFELSDAAGLAVGQTLALVDDSGDTAAHEILEIGGLAGTTVSLARPLGHAHAAASTLNAVADSGAARPTAEAHGATSGTVFLSADGAGLAAGALVHVQNGGDEEYGWIAATAEQVSIADPLSGPHMAGTALVPAAPVLSIHAMWPGGWGNALRVTVTRSPILETTVAALAPAGGITLTLATAFGLFPGSVLDLGGTLVTVAAAETESGTVTLTAPLATDLAADAPVSSVEYRVAAERLDADGRVAEDEVFDRVSFAPGHPRYAGRIIGLWDAATGRPSDSGGSVLIRVEDTTTEATRRMPLITGVARMLAGGTDDAANVTDATYVGIAALDPGNRTGIQAMENRSDISICAVPGQVSVTVQKALIAHCNKMAYRFAVLDTPQGAGVEAAKTHRQNFDTTRAAVYYPGLLVADPFGAPGDRRVIAPSGHVAGIYARTDIARGVHKAPANEVVQGILGLETVLSKGEQDVLNPVAVNCFRDFRAEFRGLRLYGARVATSDPEWTYVNVRRLLLFIENSLDTGLQWAVFEPNSEPLWASVKQSVTNFLTTVWRSGALEGTTPEEAFFVNIGYDVTMTQDDIDNGRMIVEIGVAPVKPAEFVIVRISQKTREATS